ncbi:MAG TPA: DNA polymerase III subunit gamma/tau [Nitrospirae bacterium]|nr:DNA polymerase III subunit gamma/tau [Nitrospirota bacterium]
MAYLVLARKWRPQRLSEIVGQESIARILKNAVSSKKVGHAYIFSGPRGVGKTSSARILAKILNCKSPHDDEPCGICDSCKSITEGSSLDVIEIDGASNNSVDNIRELRETVKYSPSSSRYKIYIVDEAHMLSQGAFNAFLKTLEEPPSHVIFVLATTEPRKIPITILSRCQHLPFKKISSAKIKHRLMEICSMEGINAKEQALDMIARMSEGSMRDALTILDQATSFSESLNSADIKDLFGLTDVESLYKVTKAIINGERTSIITNIRELVESGIDIKIFIKDLIQYIRNLMIILALDDEKDEIDLTEEERKSLFDLSKHTTLPHVLLILNELIKAEIPLRQSQFPRVFLEMSLLKIATMSCYRNIDDFLKMLKSPSKEVNLPANNLSKVLKTNNEVKSQELNAFSPSLTMRQLWEKTIDFVEEKNSLLALKLKEGEVNIKDDNTFHITFKGGKSVHADSVSEQIDYLKELLLKFSGRDIDIKITQDEGKEKVRDINEEARNNPIIQRVLSLYDGIIVEVKENPKKGGTDV